MSTFSVAVAGFRSKLTLNLGESVPSQRSGLGMTLIHLGLNLNNADNPCGADLIDVNVPLEKQG